MYRQRSASARSVLDLGALDVPVLLRVVLDRAVRRELAHLGRRPDALLDPLRPVLVRLVDDLERLDVCDREWKISASASRRARSGSRTGVEVLRQEIVIMLADRVEQPIPSPTPSQSASQTLTPRNEIKRRTARTRPRRRSGRTRPR